MTFVADLDEITFDAELDGELVRREIARKNWVEAGWATVMVMFEERARDGESWRSPKLMLIRLRRIGDGWKKQSQVTLPAAHAIGLRVELERTAEIFDANSA